MNSTIRKDNMFPEMRKAAREKLAGRLPENMAEKTGTQFEKSDSAFFMESLGKSIRVTYPDFQVEGAINGWHELLILHYLEMGDGSSLTGELISFGQLPQGMVRGGGFDRDAERTLGALLGEVSVSEIREVCQELGGKIILSKADLSVVFPFLPRYPITMNLWLGDDEFPGTGKLLLDRSAGWYLTIEDAVTAGGVLIEALTLRCQKHSFKQCVLK